MVCGFAFYRKIVSNSQKNYIIAAIENERIIENNKVADESLKIALALDPHVSNPVVKIVSDHKKKAPTKKKAKNTDVAVSEISPEQNPKRRKPKTKVV
jgi:DNA invertase Pin-like site-specific DNA recombinase